MARADSNQDEDIYNNKPFKDLAVGLAAQGIASLRYDKRTQEYQDEFVANINSGTIYNETIDDAVAAAKFATQFYKSIDTANIFVLGHSLGAMCAPKIAQLSSNTKGIILMAGNARPMDTLVLNQLQYLFKHDTTELKYKLAINQIKYQISILRSDTFNTNIPRFYMPLGLPTKYWQSVMQYNQVAVAKKVNKPMLVLQGERDYQVTLQDFQIWKNNLPSAKCISYPALNHLFMEGKGPSLPAEYKKQQHVAFYVITDIAQWVHSNNK